MMVDGGFGIFFILVAALNILFVVAIVLAIAWAVRWVIRQTAHDRYPSGDAKAEDTALELLRQRYARGEIDSTEYEERKRTLGG